ncbi:TPA: ASCH domain-containing protein, partial [Enterococcus faecium]
ALVLEGKKTGTCSAKKLFDYDDEPLPKEKEYSIILDGKSQPKAVIQTITVDEIAFCDVPADFAYLEGEDDRSLAQWRYAHLNYFQEVFHTYGLTFTEKEILYCETFRVCYRA